MRAGDERERGGSEGIGGEFRLLLSGSRHPELGTSPDLGGTDGRRLLRLGRCGKVGVEGYRLFYLPYFLCTQPFVVRRGPWSCKPKDLSYHLSNFTIILFYLAHIPALIFLVAIPFLRTVFWND